MEPSRSCPRCAASAQASQRWCLECGAELPQARRPGLRPAVGIATTLAVLVGAASAGGYTLLHDGAKPPPAATTIAQRPAAPATALPPATTAPSYTPYTNAPSTPISPAPTTTPTLPVPRTHGNGTGSGGASFSSSHHGASAHNTGSTTQTTHEAQTTTPKPTYALTDVALGAAAVVYAPYAANDVDLGDASRVVDGTTRTAWKTPPPTDPSSTRPEVGVYVDLASAQKLRKLVVETPTPGMSIEVYGATQGPPDAITDKRWDHLASRDAIAAKTTIGLPARSFRYVLVWIVGLPPGVSTAAISELSLLSLQPE